MAKQTTLQIPEVTWATSADGIEKALCGVPGVSKASVNFATEEARWNNLGGAGDGGVARLGLQLEAIRNANRGTYCTAGKEHLV